MGTLTVHDVPGDVVEALTRQAAAQGQSLSVYVASLLTALAARPSGEEVVARLAALDRPQGISRDDILDVLHMLRDIRDGDAAYASGDVVRGADAIRSLRS